MEGSKTSYTRQSGLLACFKLPAFIKINFNFKCLRVMMPPMLKREHLPLALGSCCILLLIIGSLLINKEILKFLDSLKTWMNENDLAGPLCLSFMTMCVCLPMAGGFSTMAIVSGYVFGGFKGTTITHLSALVGAYANFFLCRRFFKKTVHERLRKNLKWKSLIKIVNSDSIDTVIMLRLS